MNILFRILLPLIIFFPVIINAQEDESVTTYFGKVTKIVSEQEVSESETDGGFTVQEMEVEIDNRGEPEKIIVINGDQFDIRNVIYKVNDAVIIKSYTDIDGNISFRISEPDRTGPLTTIILLFVILSILIARKKAIYSLLNLIISFFIIFTLLLPMIMSGRDPLGSVILSALIFLPIIFYLSHGFNSKTTIAIIATLIALIITGLLSSIFVGETRLMGFMSEESYFLKDQVSSFNMQNLLLAGMIISVLGILDDITVSRVAIIYELKRANKDLTLKDLYFKGMNVGKDHIASMINTLVLVYAGASLPLLLLFVNNPLPLPELLSYEAIATEIVRTLVGSIGLILAVPIASYISAVYLSRRS